MKYYVALMKKDDRYMYGVRIEAIVYGRGTLAECDSYIEKFSRFISKKHQLNIGSETIGESFMKSVVPK